MPSTALLLSLLAGVAVGGHTPASSVHEDSPPLLVPKRFIVWFREGNMRVHDNAALNAAASYSGAKEVIPVCVLDTRQFEASEWGSPKMGSLRAKFLIETIGELRSNLKKLGSNLLVGIGSPEELIPLLVKRDASASEEVERVTGKSLPWSEIERATTLLFETQTTPAMADISQLVLDAMPNQVSWQHFWGGTLFNRESLPFKSDLSDVPDVFEDYKKAIGGISWEVFDFSAHPPISPICRTPLLPDLTLYSGVCLGSSRQYVADARRGISPSPSGRVDRSGGRGRLGLRDTARCVRPASLMEAYHVARRHRLRRWRELGTQAAARLRRRVHGRQGDRRRGEGQGHPVEDVGAVPDFAP